MTAQPSTDLQTGVKVPTNNIVVSGQPILLGERTITVATGMYPGVIVAKGATDNDIVVCPAGGKPIGILAYEHTSMAYRPQTPTTIYAVGDRAMVIAGDIVYVGYIAATAAIGEDLVPAASGQLTPASALAVPVGATPVTSDAAQPAITGSGVQPVAKCQLSTTITGSAIRAPVKNLI
jgi:hypothetical protein